ncbi:MAG: guanylate kinase [Clostridiales bacterium]|nr:guanylate kinase [Clostridiales bacterium]
MRKGLLFTVSGPSGVGKGTICKALLARMPELKLSVSCTTRPPRSIEREGLDYFFIGEAQFDEMVASGGFLEHAGVYGKRYGTPRGYVESMLSAGHDVLLEIEMQGSMQVMRMMPETISVFVLPPSFSELKRRLLARSTEGEEQVRLRLSNGAKEMQLAEQYRYVLMNDNLEHAVDQLQSIICAERLRVPRNRRLIEDIAKTFEKTV